MIHDLDEVWNQIYESRNMPQEERIRFLDGLLVLLEKEAVAHPKAEVYNLIGYLCYVYPEKSERMKQKMLASFSTAMELDPTFGGPPLYLGNYYYDIGNYQTALSYFEQAAKADWSNYYSLVIQELILCSVVSLEGIRSTLPRLETFVSNCLNADENDVFPNQLFNCFLRVLPGSVDFDAMESVLEVLSKLVFGIHQEAIFHDDLIRLREVMREKKQHPIK
jgi:tetratricopeptide (TPR) repeat protein